MLKKIGHEPSGGQIVKSQEISVFIILSCWINSNNWIHLSRPNCTQTLICDDELYMLKSNKTSVLFLFFANSIFKFIIHDY